MKPEQQLKRTPLRSNSRSGRNRGAVDNRGVAAEAGEQQLKQTSSRSGSMQSASSS